MTQIYKITQRFNRTGDEFTLAYGTNKAATTKTLHQLTDNYRKEYPSERFEMRLESLWLPREGVTRNVVLGWHTIETIKINEQ